MRRHPALTELSRDHHQALALALRLRRAIRAQATALQDDPSAPPEALAALGDALSAHVRLEERELLPLLESALDDAALTRLGEEVAAAERRLRSRTG